MNLGLGPSKESRMVAYFDSVYRDCYGAFDIQSRYLDHWTTLGPKPWDASRMVGLVGAGVVVMVVLFVVYELLPPIVLLVLFIVYVVLGISTSVVERFRPPPEESGLSRETRLQPGMIRKFHVTMEDAVKRTNLALTGAHIPFTAYGIVLTEREGQPRGTVMETFDGSVLVSLWKHWDDPYNTLIHVGPNSSINSGKVRALMGLLDRRLPDP
jgi:hypothetical protein